MVIVTKIIPVLGHMAEFVNLCFPPGLTVVLDHLNRMRDLSHLRAIHRGAFFVDMKTVEPRRLTGEAWGGCWLPLFNKENFQFSNVKDDTTLHFSFLSFFHLWMWLKKNKKKHSTCSSYLRLRKVVKKIGQYQKERCPDTCLLREFKL